MICYTKRSSTCYRKADMSKYVCTVCKMRLACYNRSCNGIDESELPVQSKPNLLPTFLTDVPSRWREQKIHMTVQQYWVHDDNTEILGYLTDHFAILEPRNVVQKYWSVNLEALKLQKKCKLKKMYISCSFHPPDCTFLIDGIVSLWYHLTPINNIPETRNSYSNEDLIESGI